MPRAEEDKRETEELDECGDRSESKRRVHAGKLSRSQARETSKREDAVDA